MKRKQLTLMAVLFPLLAFSQIAEEGSPDAILQQEEDSTKIESIEDIINEKEKATIQSNLIKHYDQVWRRRSFFNISYNSSTLMPKGGIVNGDGKSFVQKYKSNWGLSLQFGRNYRLHKKPIANVLQFYIDYSPVDLNFNHYKIGADGKNLYNSSMRHFTQDKKNNVSSYYYIPWDLEKYEGSLGMSVGPSFTVLPFAFIKGKNDLHFIKFNMYFRVGYQASLIFMANEEDADVNQNISPKDYEHMSDNLKMTWGHGLMTNFGLSLTWKGIGVGYEHRVAHNRYQSVSTKDFGSGIYKFKTSTDRIYISFRMGR